MSHSENNPFEDIISRINKILGDSKTSDFKTIDKHIITPAVIPIICVIVLWLASLSSKELVETLLKPVQIILIGCLLYLFGVIIYTTIQLIKSFPTRAPLINRAVHDYPLLETMLTELVKISYKERRKFVQWLENRVKQEYKVAGIMSAIYIGAPKIMKSIADLFSLEGAQHIEQIEALSGFIVILGIFAILLTLLLNSFQKYIFYTQYSIDHGNNRKTQDL